MQYRSIRDSLRLREALKSDEMYLMAIALMPVNSTTYISPKKTLTHIKSLGYEWQALLDRESGNGRIFVQSHDLTEVSTINFRLPEVRNVWEKEDIGEYEGEYRIKKSDETARIAGVPCKKITYLFSGTSQGPVHHSKVVTTIPWKVVVWYSDVVDSIINVQHPFYIKLDKAILKTEVEFDKEGKKKMVYEVTKLVRKKISDEEMKIGQGGVVINHEPGRPEAIAQLIMVMGVAGQVAWKD